MNQEQIITHKRRLVALYESDDFVYWLEKVIEPNLKQTFDQIINIDDLSEEGKNEIAQKAMYYKAVKKITKDAFEITKKELQQIQEMSQG
jgi:hypothetical protein